MREDKVVELTTEQMERLLLDRLATAQGDPTPAMWALAQFYKDSGKLDQAFERLRQLLNGATDLEAKARIVLALGQTAEASIDYELAARFYRQALSLEPSATDTWYFIHNNLGFSLNQLGRFSEGERYCRRAIGISPQRSNGYKNLGLSLAGQGRHREAAEAFVAATQANASDNRSLGHLEALLEEHPELEFDFAAALGYCRRAAAIAKKAIARADASWRRRRK
jgi:tetratricopeptide (TPR) repeat protein